MNVRYLQIFLISFFFALLVGSGFYGFGVDFYGTYHMPNVSLGSFRDRLGFVLSTLTIYEVHVGVYFVSFILSMSTGLLLFKTVHWYFYRKHYWLFFLMYLMLLHTWPIIMSTSNVMRQGLSMSFLFLALYFLLSKKYFWYLVSIGLVVMTHKSGILLALLLIGSNIYNNKIQKWFNFSCMNRNLLIISGFLLAVIVYISIPVIFNIHEDSRIISGDYSYPFLVINTVYILIFYKYLFIKYNQADFFLLICSFAFPGFLFYGFNWQYERLNMMILILYMISFSKIFIDRDKIYILLFAITLLLFMTVFTGMYTSLQ